MKMHKTLRCLLLSVLIAFAAISFVACGGSSDEPAVTSTYSIVFSSENDVCGTVSGKDSSGAAVSSGAKFEKDTALTLTATANAGYVFSGWYEGTEQVSTQAEYSFSMPARHLALVAKFTANNPTFTYSSENTIKGTVSCSIASGSEVAANQSITITANAKTNYHFDGWYEGTEQVSTQAEYSFTMPASNLTLVAKFAINAYEFACLSEDTVKGTVDCDIVSGTEVAYNTNITVSATPNDGYIFNGWYEGTTKVSPDAEYEFTMPNKALTLVAKFDSISLLVQAARTGEDANTLFFFNNKLGLYQLDSNNEKIEPSVSPSVTFNGEPVTIIDFNNVYLSGYIGIDICDYEFNTGDVAVFYAKVGEDMTANGLEFIDIRLNTDSEAVTPLNGNHLVAGKWTMCLIPADRLEEALTQLYFYGSKATDNSDGSYYPATGWSLYGSIYLTKIKVYSADEVKNMTEFDSTTEYQVGQTTFVGSVQEIFDGKGRYIYDTTVFGSDWDTAPYLVGSEVRVYARSDNNDCTDERPIPDENTRNTALGFELKDAVSTTSGKKIYVEAIGLTEGAYVQEFTGREDGHYCTHQCESIEDLGDGYVRYCFDIVDDWYETAETMKYFRLWTGHKLIVPEYEAVMIRDIYIA